MIAIADFHKRLAAPDVLGKDGGAGMGGGKAGISDIRGH
jgi:hypothetical protein